jgi:hypothetical protein
LKDDKKTKSSVLITNWKRKITCYKFSFLEFLSLKIKPVYNLLMGWRRPVFIKEVKMAKVTSDDKVLLIGGGILPSESMIITQETNASVVTIDNNKSACKHAEIFIKKRGLTDKITIKHADGIDFPVKDFDVVFIAISVWPIDVVFKNLSKNLKKGARIMCKSYKEDITGLLKNEGVLDSFRLESKIDNPSTKSYLFVKI